VRLGLNRAVALLTLGSLVAAAAIGSVKAIASGVTAYQATQQVPDIKKQVDKVERRVDVQDEMLKFLVHDVETRRGWQFQPKRGQREP
jgi:hypothetical protein